MTNNGCINVYKEKGYTSHDVVAILKKTLKTKAGHAGTLDPDARGVLVVCLGRATKIADYIGAEVKGYKAVLRLGIETDTQDMSGNVLRQWDMDLPEDIIKEAILSFVGDYDQIPPMYSALKVEGKKLYALARKGVEVERKSRQVQILAIDGIKFIDKNLVEMDVLCTKGTYIRTLCHDIGQKLGWAGCMESLLRFKSGKFTISDSLKLSEIRELAENGGINKHILPMDAVLGMDSLCAHEKANRYLYNGNKINTDCLDYDKLETGKKYKMYDYCKNFVGIYEFSGGDSVKPVTILADLTNKVKSL